MNARFFGWFDTVRTSGTLSRIVLAMSFLLVFTSTTVFAQKQSSTPWGWPQPYTQISPASVEYLKTKKWWPLTIAWQPAFSGQNATVVSMLRNDFLTKRGLETKSLEFAAGVLVNKAVVSGDAQVGAGGNFPLTSLIAAEAPIRVIAVTAPNLKHQVIVPINSKIKTLADIKGSSPPAVIGLALGSSAEFYFQSAAAVNGLVAGRDFVLKNIPLAEQQKMPADVTAVVPWDLTCTYIISELKTGRAVDVSYPYNVYQGGFYVRKEILDDAPDVAQAITDAIVEADLWMRLNEEKAAALMAEIPSLKIYPQTLLRQQIQEYNTLYKPSYMMPYGEFWGLQNQSIALWLTINGKLSRSVGLADYKKAFVEAPMRKTFEKLGWRDPRVPPFIPVTFLDRMLSSGGKLPAYDNYQSMNGKKQAWPQSSDLTRPFSFGGRTYSP